MVLSRSFFIKHLAFGCFFNIYFIYLYSCIYIYIYVMPEETFMLIFVFRQNKAVEFHSETPVLSPETRG